MTRPATPSRFRDQLTTVLDDNVNVPVATVLAFEQALRADPGDAATRQAYHDWLLEHGCPTRAEQLAAGLTDQTPGEYKGAVRPGVRPEDSPFVADWAGY